MTKDRFSALEAFARARIAADKHPGASHVLQVFSCDACGGETLTLRIEHHTGSRQRDFKGVIFGRCAACDEEGCIFSFTGSHRKPAREERPTCACGGERFLVAMVERMEGDDGLSGFFDEGVIVGACAECGTRRVFVFTD